MIMNKKCIILGGNGFIGSNLIEYLSNYEFDITSFDKEEPMNRISNVKYLQADFTDDNKLLSAVQGQDIIIHLISSTNPSKSIENPYSGYNIDVIQTIKILEKVKNTDSKVIFASSGGTVYGEPESCPIKEEHELNPISHYGIVKTTIEHIINMYNSVYGMNNIIMRISNPYGPGQDYRKGVGLIDAVIKKALQNEVITVWGDGNVIRDYIYIDDLCTAILELCRYTGNEKVFNIGSGKGYSINNILEIVEGIIKKDLKVEYLNSRKNDIKHIYLNIELLQKALNFTPQTDINKGIKLYLDSLN
ncbi:NAD-dependent epimerase/dehydratase family protein [Clostridium butyricum]|uniref:NAD-dependent epimerase/dehydratase family protein n=1 Tax=Clostridium butyricum TaxID=1492 RepID=UPI00374EC832